ncbi:SGNH hydrolase-type esterase domain-containing protein [Xylaria sp. FL0043]|nr:SGNH hydrolase-type esterase domain-containing protein [Xylaria sp. FL0043]
MKDTTTSLYYLSALHTACIHRTPTYVVGDTVAFEHTDMHTACECRRRIQLEPPRGRGRLSFLKSKRTIVTLTLLVVVSVVLIVLGVTHNLTPSKTNSVGNEDSLSNSIGTGSGGSSGGSGGTNNNSSGSDGSGDASGGHNSTGSDSHHDNDDSDEQDDHESPPKKPALWRPKNSSSIADGTPLRIMCLGASIVRGELSSDRNGFRKTLRGDLAKLGVPINMVGTQRNGDMPDNDFEAYGGNRISQIHDHAKNIVPQEQPNIFVINVGTNNVLQYKDTDVAGQHMEAFIDYLLTASPRSTVVLSTLLTNTVPNREPLILDINRQFRELYPKYENNTVVLAELHPSSGLPGRPQVEDISYDGSHPTDRGYEIMGHIMAQAVQDADRRGYLRWPEDGEPYDGEADRVNAAATA